MSEERKPRIEEVQTQRRRREGMGADRNLKLYVPEAKKDPNLHYRWVMNRAGRVEYLTKEDDYDVVSASDIASVSGGTTVERTADKQNGERMILLSKPKKYHEADRAKAAEAIAATEDAMRRAPPASPEGLSGPTAYVPGGKNIVAGR